MIAIKSFYHRGTFVLGRNIGGREKKTGARNMEAAFRRPETISWGPLVLFGSVMLPIYKVSIFPTSFNNLT